VGVIFRHGIEVEYKMNAATHHVLGRALASHLFESILIGLPLAIIAIGAADNIVLPNAIQHVVTRLDVTWWILPKGIPGESTPAFVHWALPLNAVFYSFLGFLFSIWRSPLPSMAKPKFKKVENTTTPSPSNLDPNYSKVPALAEILDRRLLLQQLSLLPVFQRTSALRDVEVSVMRNWGTRRAMVEISLRSAILGKVYATNRQDVYEFMVALKDAGFDRDADFSIPQPIAYLPALNLLLQELVEGPIARKVLKDDDERVRVGAAEQCGRWLGTFHSRAPRNGQVQEFEDFLADLEKRGQALSEAGTLFAGKTKRLMESLGAAQPGPGAVKLCPGHGDFGPYQVVLAPKRTAVFDWDGFDVGDPTRDVARFVVSLEKRAFSPRSSYRMEACIAAFLEAYFATGGQREVAARLPFYKAATYLRRAGRIGRKRQPGWEEQAERCVDVALLTLQEVDVTPAVR
jgi:aminoglycoside phosphotransferase (APT) family kinase protein